MNSRGALSMAYQALRSGDPTERFRVGALIEGLLARPPVRLKSGNFSSILGACGDVAAKEGWSLARWREFRDEAMAGTYEEFIACVEANFTVTRAPTFSTNPNDWNPEVSER